MVREGKHTMGSGKHEKAPAGAQKDQGSAWKIKFRKDLRQWYWVVRLSDGRDHWFGPVSSTCLSP